MEILFSERGWLESSTFSVAWQVPGRVCVVQVETNTLGSPAGKELLDHLKPLRWWAGHLHCRFEAKYVHKITEEPSRSTKSSTTSEDTPTAPTIPTSVAEVTEFLALDKCLPKRQFLEVCCVSVSLSSLSVCDQFPWIP